MQWGLTGEEGAEVAQSASGKRLHLALTDLVKVCVISIAGWRAVGWFVAATNALTCVQSGIAYDFKATEIENRKFWADAQNNRNPDGTVKLKRHHRRWADLQCRKKGR